MRSRHRQYLCQEPTKKRHTDEDLVTIRLGVHPNNAEKIKEYACSIETGSERNYTVAEVFPDYIGKEQQTAIRAYHQHHAAAIVRYDRHSSAAY